MGAGGADRMGVVATQRTAQVHPRALGRASPRQGRGRRSFGATSGSVPYGAAGRRAGVACRWSYGRRLQIAAGCGHRAGQDPVEDIGVGGGLPRASRRFAGRKRISLVAIGRQSGGSSGPESRRRRSRKGRRAPRNHGVHRGSWWRHGRGTRRVHRCVMPHDRGWPEATWVP